jgi:ribosome maturation factor RimP
VEVREEVRQLAEPLAEEHGYELVDIEQASVGHHRVIRIYLDKPGGVTLDDCARFSRHLADAMDMNQIIPGAYHLEVSSPGLERPIRTLEDDSLRLPNRSARVLGGYTLLGRPIDTVETSRYEPRRTPAAGR